jgi:hypothetical protein
MKRILTIGFFALALLVGPVGAACGDCCPEAVQQASLTSPEACCGDCEPSVERTPDPASLAFKGTAPGTDLAAGSAPATPVTVASMTFFTAATTRPPRSSRLSSSLPPLRL